MRKIVNGKIVELTTEPDGSIRADDLMRAAGIPAGREFIIQMPDGSNRVVNQGEKLSGNEEQFFVDAPKHKRGTSGSRSDAHRRFLTAVELASDRQSHSSRKERTHGLPSS